MSPAATGGIEVSLIFGAAPLGVQRCAQWNKGQIEPFRAAQVNAAYTLRRTVDRGDLGRWKLICRVHLFHWIDLFEQGST